MYVQNNILCNNVNPSERTKSFEQITLKLHFKASTTWIPAGQLLYMHKCTCIKYISYTDEMCWMSV